MLASRRFPYWGTATRERAVYLTGGRILTIVSSSAANEQTATDLFPLILHSLDEDKAQEVVSIDLMGKTAIADQMVIATGRSQRHVGALADHLQRRLREAGHGRCKVEGMQSCDWVLLDAGDVIVHIFRPEVRDFYRLEKIWGVDAKSAEDDERAAV